MDSFSSKQNQEEIELHTNNDDHDRDDYDYCDRLYPDGGLQYSLEFLLLVNLNLILIYGM